jgi:hypothetical protein
MESSITRPSFDEALERAAQRGDEWQFGAILTDIATVPVTSRLRYLPRGVVQRNNVMDTNGCASRAPLNLLETKLNFLYDNGMHPVLKKWCDDNGYRINGSFALADAFIEILSNTTRSGNGLKQPVDAIRKFGVIPMHLLPLKDGMTWDEYMDKDRILPQHLDLGQEFLKRFPIAYEQVVAADFGKTGTMLDVGVHGWPFPNDLGVYERTDNPFNHACAYITADIYANDSYDPFLKRLAQDYRFFDWGYRLAITAQNPDPTGAIRLGLLQQVLITISRLLDAIRGVR